MPYLNPRSLWAQIEQSVIVGAFSNHVSALEKEQSRQAEYDRQTALPGVCPGRWAMSGATIDSAGN
jgi:hypothetical protein